MKSKRVRSAWIGPLVLALAACSSGEVVEKLPAELPPVILTRTGPGDHSSIRVAEYLEQGKTHFRAGRYAPAVDSFRAAMDLDARSQTAINGIGASYDMMGRHELAQAYYRRSLGQFSDSADTLNNLGFSLLLQGDVELAERYLKAAYALAGSQTQGSIIERNVELATFLASQQKMLRSARPATDPFASPVGPPVPLYRVITRSDAGEATTQKGDSR